jgi:hypothetical protein
VAKRPRLSFLPVRWHRKLWRDAGFHWLNGYPVNYLRVGNASRAFSEVRDYTEMKVRTLLTRRKRRRKARVGWQRWSNEYLYKVLGRYGDWKIHPVPSAASYKGKGLPCVTRLITLATQLTG